MKIKSFDYDLETGFAWIIVDDQACGEWTVQCCLKDNGYNAENGENVGFIEAIDQDDCGHNDGICGDVNEKAFNFWGENRCMTALFDKARDMGIELV